MSYAQRPFCRAIACAALTVLASANLGWAADSPPAVPAGQTGAAPQKVVVLHAGRLLDRPGRAPRGPSTIVIRDGRISEVRDGFVDVPGSQRVLDQRTRCVLPGLIDSHVHLVADTGGQARKLEDVQLEDAQLAYNALANALRAGKVVGPNIVDAGRSISTTSGHMNAALGYHEDFRDTLHAHENLCDSAESCRRAVRTQVGRGVDVIKIATTGGVNSQIGAGLGQQMFDDEVRAVVETAKLYGKKVAVHAHGNDGIKVALAAGVDSIEHGTMLDDDSIALFLKTGAYYVPTLSTVAGVSRHGRNADEFELMVKHGMTPAAAVQAATVNAADLLGLQADVGTLEPGKRADLIAVDGDPLADVTVLKHDAFVMKDGVEFRAGKD